MSPRAPIRHFAAHLIMATVMTTIMVLVTILASVFPAEKTAHAKTFDGVLRSLADADSFIIDNIEVRLYGIDAFELHQFCGAKNQAQPCGEQAKDFMRHAFKGMRIRCHIRTVDRYERFITDCYTLSSQIDLAGALVEAGWAYATSHKYRPLMEDAQRNCRGVWQYAQPVHPRKWRKKIRNLDYNDPILKTNPDFLGSKSHKCT